MIPRSDPTELEAVRARALSGAGRGRTHRNGRRERARFSVRTLAYLICGHEIHHEKMLRGRYGIDGQAFSTSKPPWSGIASRRE